MGRMNNRRASERRMKRTPVELRCFSERNVVVGTAVNLSEGGALVELSKPVKELPNLVVVSLSIDGAATRLQALVQRTESFRGKARIGLRFLELGERQRHALRRNLRSDS
ncbi:MAG: PilZ domain-containing protein [Deltaproteobacteria bacterium]